MLGCRSWSAMYSITAEQDKTDVTIKYEHGLTNLLVAKEMRIRALYTVRGRDTYNKPKKLFQQKFPFIKKASFTRHNGALGAQVKYVLDHTNVITRTLILNSANRLYGAEYMRKFLTYNPIKILTRNIKYAFQKSIKDKAS